VMAAIAPNRRVTFCNSKLMARARATG
jgi:hypothetical protein